MAENKDFRPIIDELRNQGWHLERTGTGHYRAKPPTGKGIVHFAASGESHALKNALADLKKHGFTWPAPSKQELRELRAANGVPECQDEDLTPDHPTPPAKEETSEERLDRLYNSLREAKGYLTLADEHLTELELVVKEVTAKRDSAKSERDRAADRFRQAKVEFDEAVAA
jgi:hypothetical protein